MGFDSDIRPLFRDKDRSEMEWAFDLWDYDDVQGEAEAILDRLEAGNMPCDERWPSEQVEVFRKWIAEGMPP